MGASATRKSSILCIDDEPNVLVLRRTLLGNAGYKVHLAEDGEKGLAIFRNEDIDLAVVDYKMPGMLGDEVAREMRRLRSHVPLLLVTAYHNLPWNCTSVFNATVLKGESPTVLLEQIKVLLAGNLR